MTAGAEVLKLFAFCFYFLFLVSDSARTGRRRVEARRGRREARPARRVHRQRGAEPHAAEHHHQAREAPEASVARALDVAEGGVVGGLSLRSISAGAQLPGLQPPLARDGGGVPAVLLLGKVLSTAATRVQGFSCRVYSRVPNREEGPKIWDVIIEGFFIPNFPGHKPQNAKPARFYRLAGVAVCPNFSWGAGLPLAPSIRRELHIRTPAHPDHVS